MQTFRVLDPRFDKRGLLSANAAKFSALMREVDAHLKNADVPIFARPLRAIPIVCMKGGYSLMMDEPLAERINAWFVGQYGERLNVDMSLGYGPVLVRGELYKMCSPWLIAGGRIVCFAGKVGQGGSVPIVNVLEYIEGLTDQRASDLRTDELLGLRNEFILRQGLFLDIRQLQNDGVFKAALGDIESAVDALFQQRPHVGKARWDCLQAVEKFIKGWISKKGGTFSNTHSLAALNGQVSSLGLARVPDADLAAVQCNAGVRYGEITVSNEDVASAFNAMLRCCAFVAKQVKVRATVTKPLTRVPGPNALTKEGFLALKVGDKLRAGRSVLVITGIAQQAPRWYRTLALGATLETVIIEGDFASFSLVSP
jgi:hypothetical protein